MSEPARNLYDDELPEDKYAPRPKFGVVDGGGETTDRKKGHLKAVGDKSLAGQEEKATETDSHGTPKSLKAAEERATSTTDEEDSYDDDDEDDGLFNDDTSSKKGFRGWSRRKKAAAGALGVGGISGFLLFFTLGAAPAQIAQLAEILQTNDINNEETSDRRITALYRYARSGDIGQTRLSKRGSASVAATQAALAEAGIDITPSSTWGQFDDVKIDTSKYPGLSGVGDRDEAIRRIAQDLDIPEANIQNLGGTADGNFKFRIGGDRSTKFTENLLNKSVGLLDEGRISTAMKRRFLKQYFNVPSLLHPLKRLASSAENNLANRLDSRAKLKERAKANQADRAPPVPEEAVEAKSSLRSRMNGFRQAAAGVLTVTSAACTIRENAGNIITLNRAQVVVPAVIEATHIMSLYAQITTGQDFDVEDLNATVESFTDDEGGSIWEAKSLQATTGAPDPQGTDITNENKQAFAGDTTVANLQGLVDFPGIGAACSPAGQVTQAVVSIALIVGTGGSGASATTFSRAVVAQAATTIAKEAVQGVIGSIVMDMLLNRVDVWLSDKPFFELPPTGALGGNMLAYGAREAANITARASGGIQLSDEETAAIDRKIIESEKQELQTRSFAQRMFDINDYRSLAAISMRSVAGNPLKKSATNLASFSSLRNIFTNLSTILLPSTIAQEESAYQWYMPRYGIPQAVLDNPAYADPYEVANSVAALLDGPGGQAYIDKAEICFGVTIGAAPERTVTADGDVNPGTLEYTNANCMEDSDEWHRIMLYVNDSIDMATVACWDGSDESACQELGFESSSSGGSGATLDGVTCPDNMQAHPTQEGYFRMPDAPNGEYIIYSGEDDRYGSEQLVCVLYSVGLAYAAAYGPGKSVLYIGDLNASGHRSHFKGVAVDVDGGCPEAGCLAAADHTGNANGTYDTQATKDLGRLFIDTGVIKNIWWCPNDDSLEDIKAYAVSKGTPLVGAKCISGHENHFHIDISDEYVIPGSFTP